MKAVILAGGKGTRLRPYTTTIPKPLMPLGNKAILEVVIQQLKEAGFDEIIITVGYLSELIRAFIGDGSKYGIKVTYYKEDSPLGTAGPLANIGDLALVITDYNMPEMDGIELIMELRMQEAYRFVPVLVLTTEAMSDLKEKGAREGASGWLTKPFTPDVLIKNVGKLVR